MGRASDARARRRVGRLDAARERRRCGTRSRLHAAVGDARARSRRSARKAAGGSRPRRRLAEGGVRDVRFALLFDDAAGARRARWRTRAGDARSTALSWMDHEFGSEELQRDQAGWDWFAIQLDDRREIMDYRLRRSGRALDARVERLARRRARATCATSRATTLLVDATGTWRSPHTGGVYPSGWRVRIPSARLDLTLTPALPTGARERPAASPTGKARSTSRTRRPESTSGSATSSSPAMRTRSRCSAAVEPGGKELERARLELLDRADLRDVLEDDGFDPAFQRRMRGRAAAAGADHLHVGDAVVDAHEPDVAAVALDRRTDAIERAFDALLDER